MSFGYDNVLRVKYLGLDSFSLVCYPEVFVKVCDSNVCIERCCLFELAIDKLC